MAHETAAHKGTLSCSPGIRGFVPGAELQHPEQAGIPRRKEEHPGLHLCHCAQLNDGKGEPGVELNLHPDPGD